MAKTVKVKKAAKAATKKPGKKAGAAKAAPAKGANNAVANEEAKQAAIKAEKEAAKKAAADKAAKDAADKEAAAATEKFELLKFHGKKYCIVSKRRNGQYARVSVVGTQAELKPLLDKLNSRNKDVTTDRHIVRRGLVSRFVNQK